MKRLSVPLSLALVLVWGIVSVRAAKAQAQYPAEVLRFADWVLYSGKVLTVDRDDVNFSIQEAVAIRDGKILAVGNSQAILAMAGPQTKKTDLQGKTVVPGFVDTDSDGVMAGGDWTKATQVGEQVINAGPGLEWSAGSNAEAFAVSVAGMTAEETAENIKIIVARGKPSELVFARAPKSYPIAMRNWTYKDLDRMAPNNPLAVIFDGLTVIANSAMMKRAFDMGLSKDMYCVIKDSSGQPTGQFCQRAGGFFMNAIRPFPDAQSLEGITTQMLKLLNELNRVGVTSLVGHATGVDMFILNRLYHRNELPIRFGLSFDLRLATNIGPLLNRIGNMVDFSLGDMVQIIGAHVAPIDLGTNVPDNILTHVPRRVIPELPNLPGDAQGTGENQWAGTTWTKKRWEDLTPQERMDTEWGTVLTARKLGWNFAGIHNMGSKAAEIWLQTVQQAESQDGNRIQRYRPFAFDHNLVWHPITMDLALQEKDIVRFGLTTSEIFSQREVRGKRKEILAAQWGDMMHTMQPVRELLEKGIPFSLEGGDPWRKGPLQKIQQFVTRKDAQGRVWGARHAIDRKTALLASTRWSARYVNWDTLGSIEPGKLADLVVLEGDFLGVPDDQIAKIPVGMTIVSGKAVYERE